jgi:hypothetical protein
MKDTGKMLTEDEALQYLMKRQNCSRDEAIELLSRFCKEVPSGWTYVPNSKTLQ